MNTSIVFPTLYFVSIRNRRVNTSLIFKEGHYKSKIKVIILSILNIGYLKLLMKIH